MASYSVYLCTPDRRLQPPPTQDYVAAKRRARWLVEEARWSAAEVWETGGEHPIYSAWLKMGRVHEAENYVPKVA